MILYAFILIPIIGAILLYLIPGKNIMRFVFSLQIFLLGLSIYNFMIIKNKGIIEKVIGGFPKIAGITLKCDTLAGAMLILTAFIFIMCFIFGLMDKFMNNKFIFFFTILQALIMAIFLTRDIFNIYVVTEISTIVVAVLIMFKKDTRSMYDGMMYLITNIAAMSFYLFGVAMLYKTFGTLDMDILEANMHLIENTKSLILPFAFIMTGVSLKCAFLPLFNWLPNAHATPSAPSIVSVVLSGLYVKCGIYMFIRFREMFEPALLMDELFLLIGIATGITGFILAISQKDIKRILAFHTVSQMGLILMGITSGGEEAYYGGILHILNHAIFKSLLFLAAGAIISAYNTRNITKIRGVFKAMPYVSITAFAAMLGITGAPLFNGSISKYFIEAGFHGSWIEYFVIFINLGTIISFIKISQIFFGESTMEKIKIDIWKKIPLSVMAVLCLVMGFAGPVMIETIFNTHVNVENLEYIKNVVIFFVSLGTGYFIYEKILKKTTFIKKGITREIGVNGIAIEITGFFAMMVLFTYMAITIF